MKSYRLSLFALIFFVSLISIKSAFLKKKKTIDSFEDKVKALNYQLPAEYQRSASYEHKLIVEKKAKDQVAAARNLLTHPNKISKLILQSAAKQLKILWTENIVKQHEKCSKSFNRSIFGGIFDKPASEAKSRSLLQTQRISRVADSSPKTLPIDNAGILAILGDIGAASFDCDLAKTKIEDCTKFEKRETEIAYCNIKKVAMDRFFKKGDERNCMNEEFIRMAKDTRGGSAIAPNKKAKNGNPAERSMLFASGEKTKYIKPDPKVNKCIKKTVKGTVLKLDPRSGVLSNTTDKSGFEAHWPWQTLPEIYLKNCAEPWAGHYSGSIVETIFMLDVFTSFEKELGRDHALRTWKLEDNASNRNLKSEKCKKILGKVNKQNQKNNQKINMVRTCKAALAGAFLISIGYHSAIEVKPTIWAFLDKGRIHENPKIFSVNNQTCDLNATEDMINLFEKCTEYLRN